MELNYNYHTITLRIHSRSLPIGKLTEQLYAVPSAAYDIDSLISKTNPRLGRRTEALWLLEYKFPNNTNLDHCFQEPLFFLEERIAILKELNSDVSIDIFCGLYLDVGKPALSLSLDSNTIQRISLLRLDLLIDIIPYSDG